METPVAPGIIPSLYKREYDFPRRAAPPATRLMIAGIPRTGSTYLCALLWRTGALGAPMEYLNLSNRDDDMMPRLGMGSLVAYWQELQRVRTSPNGVFGFKAFPQDFRQVARRCPELLPEIRADKVVYISRRDKLAQAVSYSRAVHGGQWFSELGGRRQPRYDPAIISTALDWIDEIETGWELLFARKACTPLRIFYEDMDHDPDGTVDGILDFAGVSRTGISPSDIPLPRRQRDAMTDEWIASYRANNRMAAP